MKPKKLSFIEKFIRLAILSVNSVYKFSKMYLSYCLHFTTNYFSKMALVGFQYEQGILDVNEVCFEEQDIHNTRQKSSKSQSVADCVDVG